MNIKNEKDDEYIDPPSEEKYRIKSEIIEGISEEDTRNSLSAKKPHTK